MLDGVDGAKNSRQTTSPTIARAATAITGATLLLDAAWLESDASAARSSAILVSQVSRRLRALWTSGSICALSRSRRSGPHGHYSTTIEPRACEGSVGRISRFMEQFTLRFVASSSECPCSRGHYACACAEPGTDRRGETLLRVRGFFELVFPQAPVQLG